QEKVGHEHSPLRAEVMVWALFSLYPECAAGAILRGRRHWRRTPHTEDEPFSDLAAPLSAWARRSPSWSRYFSRTRSSPSRIRSVLLRPSRIAACFTFASFSGSIE